MTRAQVIGVVLSLVALGIGITYWQSPRYGRVSHEAYQFATALYGAALAESPGRVDSIADKLEDTNPTENRNDPESLSSNELRWLQGIIESARRGRWNQAARNARRMMEEQVRHER